MKRVFVLAAVLAVAVYATMAWSATPPTPTEQRLLKDVAALKAQVKALKKSVKDTRQVAIGIGIIGACDTAIAADGLQGTWQVIDQLSAATQAGKTYFGPQTPVSDTIGGAAVCSQIGVTRSQGPPPTSAPFSALLALFQANRYSYATSAYRSVYTGQ